MGTKKRSMVWRIARAVLLVLLVAVLLVFIALGLTVWLLKPEQLTPMVNRLVSEAINGTVTVERAELTFFKTFPRLTVDVSGLTVTSRSLDGVDAEIKSRLPEGSDTLLRLRAFHGEVQPLALLVGKISIGRVTLDRPEVLLVEAAPGVTNYDIALPTDSTTTTGESGGGGIPEFEFSLFEIVGEGSARYVSLPQDLDAEVSLRTVRLEGEEQPRYVLQCNADATALMPGLDLSNVPLGLAGTVLWNHKEPMRIGVSDLKLSAGDIRTETNAEVEIGDTFTVNSLDFKLERVAVNAFLPFLPADVAQQVRGVKNSVEVEFSARLLKPYRVGVWLPTVDVEMAIPMGKIQYNTLKVNELNLQATAQIDGENLDRSRIEVKRLFARGEGVAFTLTAQGEQLLSDPWLRGTFEGKIDFSRIPKNLLSMVGATAEGTLLADAKFDVRKSDLTRNTFHRMHLTGDVTLRDFSLNSQDLSVTMYTRLAQVKLGTDASFVRGEHSVDSLLTASLKIDTISADVPGLTLTAANLLVGAGAKNTAASADTNSVIPLGAVLRIGRAGVILTDDSTRLRLKDINARASIRRFNNEARVPQMTLNFTADRMRYADTLNRLTLRQSEVSLSLNLNKLRQSKRMQMLVDSIAAVHPDWRPDSVLRYARRMMPRRARTAAADSIDRETIDFGLDRETQSLLRRWRAHGTVKARRARLMTPLLPLRNTLSNLDLTFNDDSVTLRDTRLKVGRTDFTINGSVTNLQRAVTSRTGRQVLNVNFRLNIDTIDINQVTAAIFAGAAFAERQRQGLVTGISDSDDDDDVQNSIDHVADTTVSGPLLIPTNIDANLSVSARNVLYSDFVLHRLRGSVGVHEGAVNLRNLSAQSEMGGIGLTALYEGLSRDSLSFAFGMKVDDFHVRRFLSLMPALDTIMPLMREISGIINADVAATSELDPDMNIRIPTLNAAVTIEGDSLVLLDSETFKSIGKWLLFKDKQRNVIDSMTVRLSVHDSQMELYPFIFTMDRYKLGVFGSNDLALNFKYHVSVLKSPIPFKFGINVSGNPDKFKVRLGGAKVNEKTVGQTITINDTTRINLVNQIQDIFRRGVRTASNHGRPMLRRIDRPEVPKIEESAADTISSADSLLFIREGLLSKGGDEQ